METNIENIKVTPLTPAIGAVVDGVDLREKLSNETVKCLRAAWLDRGVLFFREQDINEQQLEAFLSYFGEAVPEPSAGSYGADTNRAPVHGGDTGRTKAVAERWHIDNSWIAEPPVATVLRLAKVPPLGGDTCWTNVGAAYGDLIEPLRDMLDKLTASHWMAPSLEAMGTVATNDDLQADHPVVSVHPETGRKCLFVNEAWTRKINELPPEQSMHVLSMLYSHIRSPLFSVRWRWTAGDVAFWDNRAVQHFAVPDYEGGRIIQRAVTAGWTPRGPQDR